MAEVLTPTQEVLVGSLYDDGIIQFGDFTLKSGAKSPVYINLRDLQLFPWGSKRLAVDEYVTLVGPLRPDILAPIPMAALPMGSSVSDRTGIPTVMIRPKKGYGTHAAETDDYVIDGLREEHRGKTAAVLDDVISTAGSKLQAIDVLESNGLRVHDVVILIDRETGGREELKVDGYILHAALGMRTMTEALHRDGRISTELRDNTLRYIDKEHAKFIRGLTS